MSAITELARAKVNLTLKVLGRRADGYHVLESLIAFAGVGDVVRFEPGARLGVEVSGPFAAAITGHNLVETALQRLSAAHPDLTLGHVTIDKRLPIAAGIGGGSADAAAVLRAVRHANAAVAGKVDWAGLAARLGADVPVCLGDRAALVWGIGEHIEPVPELPQLHAVLVCPDSAAPLGKTKSVFARLSVPPAPTEAPPAPLPRFADGAALLAYMRANGNDLRAAARAVLPASAGTETALTALPECLHVSLSGAGPTCFGIFQDATRATAAADVFQAAHPSWWVAATTLGD